MIFIRKIISVYRSINTAGGIIPPTADILLLEDGVSFITLENGDNIILG